MSPVRKLPKGASASADPPRAVSAPPPPPPAQWRLKELMEQRGWNQRKLAQALNEAAYPVSEPNLSRLVNGRTAGFNLHLVGVLCHLFDCAPNDLFELEAPPARRSKARPLTEALRKQAERVRQTGELPSVPPDMPRMSPEERAKVVGPSVRALPRHLIARKDGPT